MKITGQTTKNEGDILLCYCVSIGRQAGRGVRHRHCLTSSGSSEHPPTQTLFTLLSRTHFKLENSMWSGQGLRIKVDNDLLPAVSDWRAWILPVTFVLLTQNSESLYFSLCKQTNTEGVKLAGIHSHLPCKPTMQNLLPHLKLEGA